MKFAADVMLGRLAKWLLILGYDVTYSPASNSESLMNQARREDRILLTRNRRLSQTSRELKVLLIESDHWRIQLAEVLKAFRLRPGRSRFRRCLLCNQRLLSLPKNQVEGRVPDFVFLQFQSFSRCPRCDRIYWQGSHQSRMAEIISQLLSVRDSSLPRINQ